MKKYNMKINGQSYEAKIVEFNDAYAKISINGINFDVEFEGDSKKTTTQIVQVERTVPVQPETKKVETSECEVKAPVPGMIVKILKNESDTVKVGDILLTLEAMKMESEIVSPVNGTVEIVYAKEKDPVAEGDILMKLVTETTTVKEVLKPKITYSSAVQPSEPITPSEPKNKQIKAPLPGSILDIKVNVGDKINKNQVIIVLEAMKMESEIYSDYEGIVKSILVSKGQVVSEGQLMIEIIN